MRYTKEMDAYIRLMIESGLSYNDVRPLFNNRFSLDVSRGALVGRGSRIGLKSNWKAEVKPKPEPVKLEPPPKVARVLWTFKALPGMNPVDIMNLNSTTCRWPIDGGFYCGNKSVGVYCVCHSVMARGNDRRERRV